MNSTSSLAGLNGIPALRPPPGVTPDFIHPQSFGQRVTVTSVICLTLMTMSVIVRLYTKLSIKHVWGWDDCGFFLDRKFESADGR